MLSVLKSAPVVPLVNSNQPEEAVATTEALVKGGLRVIEVVLRTENALSCMQAIVDQCENAITGAGTVLSLDQAKASIDHGASFIVSPGLDPEVVEFCLENSIPVFPGTVTATEVQRAWNMGLRCVKFFPAGLSGGPAMVKALGSVFSGMQFMPTGGVSPANLGDYLTLDAVLACGGSWLTPKEAISAGNYDAITMLAQSAVDTAKAIRKL